MKQCIQDALLDYSNPVTPLLHSPPLYSAHSLLNLGSSLTMAIVIVIVVIILIIIVIIRLVFVNIIISIIISIS